MKKFSISLFLSITFIVSVLAQKNNITINVKSNQVPVEFASVYFSKLKIGGTSDTLGKVILSNIPIGKHLLNVTVVGFEKYSEVIEVSKNNTIFSIELKPSLSVLDEVVVTGNLKEMRKSESIIAVELYSPKFFERNPTPSLFEAMSSVNGVRPQLQCSVCNTGDIHINGMEGPYTMVLIDNMPIVSGLSTVYGLSGIPNSIVERIEIVKGLRRHCTARKRWAELST